MVLNSEIEMKTVPDIDEAENGSNGSGVGEKALPESADHPSNSRRQLHSLEVCTSSTILSISRYTVQDAYGPGSDTLTSHLW
jgi:hypothetical protein